jgi:hypothetical protein
VLGIQRLAREYGEAAGFLPGPESMLAGKGFLAARANDRQNSAWSGASCSEKSVKSVNQPSKPQPKQPPRRVKGLTPMDESPEELEAWRKLNERRRNPKADTGSAWPPAQF